MQSKVEYLCKNKDTETKPKIKKNTLEIRKCQNFVINHFDIMSDQHYNNNFKSS